MKHAPFLQCRDAASTVVRSDAPYVRQCPVLERYDIVTDFAKIGPNSEANKYLAQLAALARIRKHITYHTARHTCATLLVHQGVPITTVQKLLGHTSVRTT